jgi:hypothetical protein
MHHRLGIFSICIPVILMAQSGIEKDYDPALELRSEIQILRQSLDQIRQELAASRQESVALRRDLQALREEFGRPQATPRVDAKIPLIEEQQQMINAKLDEQQESKVGSGSKYRVRLSGMVLFNGAVTRGAVDHLDIPTTAELRTPADSGGSLVGSLRQSQIGMEVFGPDWRGARTSGSVQVDFFGGFPAANDGLTAGLIRLRTARVALDWKNTSIVAGQEAPFFSPLSPSSLVSSAYPSFSNTGNLWTWTPEIYVEHRIDVSDQTKLSIRGGFLDPLTGEPPASEYERQPTAGERSRVPAFATRVGWQRTSDGRQASAGLGGWYSRQNWGFARTVDGWAATADWNLPVGRWFAWSGELYRGRAMGGFGGGPNSSVLFDSAAQLLPLKSSGGWTQWKFQPVERWQFNVAFGEDYTSGNGLARASGVYVRRNAAGMFNFIYQARSNLLLSAEYRRLWTRRSLGLLSTADYFSLGAGILF